MTLPNNMRSDRVSIVMCTYNGEEFIHDQLQSILSQSYIPYEIIVVDDCSADGTYTILLSFANKNNLIKLFRNNSNLGYNKNFEKAIALATGDIVAIADQDDIWDVKKIEVMLSAWTGNTLLAYCDSIKFNEEVPKKIKAEPFIKKIYGDNPLQLAIRNTVSGHAMMFKQELVRLVTPFDQNIYYDWWLAIVAMSNGGITYVPAILVYQRAHSNNATMEKNLSKHVHFTNYKTMLAAHLKKFKTIPNLTAYQKQFLTELEQLWNQSLQNKTRFGLFSFLMKHRKVLYKYKNRKFGFFSHLKHSYRYAFKSL